MTESVTVHSVFIVDDHPVFRQGLRDILSTERTLQVVGEAGDGAEALSVAQTVRPDLVMMDVNLPSLNGLVVTQRLRAAMPALRVIILTGYDDAAQRLQAVRAGAAAFCAKEILPAQLLSVIRAVLAGQFCFAGQVFDEHTLVPWVETQLAEVGTRTAASDADAYHTLSPREAEILDLVTHGLSNKEIAHRLGISHQTVKNHMTKILDKLDLLDRTQAAVYALSRGWVRLREQQETADG